MVNTATCRCCTRDALEVLLDLGPQPICSHFLTRSDAEAPRHPLVFARCTECGQLQLKDPAPAALLQSPHAWVSYIEPEGHLDRLVDEVCALPGANSLWTVGGVTYKDASTLERLRKRGWQGLWQLDSTADLDMDAGVSDLALVQERLTPERARRAAEKYGKAHVLLVRHILEHTYRPADFLAALKELVLPGGVIVLECPDSQAAFLHRDYTVLWEEHLWYFTPELFARFFSHFGMRLERLRVFAYPVENSLVAFIQTDPSDSQTGFLSSSKLEDERRWMRRYVSDFSRQKTTWRNWILSHQGRVAAFGAGHATVAFINYFELDKSIEFVADDHPKKQGLFLPGSSVSIMPSAELLRDQIDHCLMGLSPESEAKVLARQDAAVKKGVVFASIFSMSTRGASPTIPARGANVDVLRMDPDLPALGDAGVVELRDTVQLSSRFRNRFCAHASSSDPLHEMIICLHAKTYVRPHRHLDKVESVHVIEGFADLVLFQETGSIDRVIRLGPPGSGLTWYIRMHRPVFHTLVLHGELFVFHETTLGPFQRESTEMASWAPEETSLSAVANYKTDLLGLVLTRMSRESMEARASFS